LGATGGRGTRGGKGTGGKGIVLSPAGQVPAPEAIQAIRAIGGGRAVVGLLERSFGIFKGEQDFEVVIALDRWPADMMRGRRWHDSQRVDELPRGEMRITFRLDNLEEIEPWVLSWGAHATVLKPKALADRVLATARAMQEQFQSPRQVGTSPEAALTSRLEVSEQIRKEPGTATAQRELGLR
jgi:hypothetical protein